MRPPIVVLACRSEDARQIDLKGVPLRDVHCAVCTETCVVAEWVKDGVAVCTECAEKVQQAIETLRMRAVARCLGQHASLLRVRVRT